MTLGTREIDWVFIVAEIGEDEGILGNDFVMSQNLTLTLSRQKGRRIWGSTYHVPFGRSWR